MSLAASVQPPVLREAAFAWVRRALRDAEAPLWLAARRQAAARRFEEAGFPTRKSEAWRFTPTDSLVEAAWAPAPGARLEAILPLAPAPPRVEPGLPGLEGELRVALVDGRLAEVPRLPSGVEVRALAEVLCEDANLLLPHLGKIAQPAEGEPAPFLDLNTALFEDGVLVHLREGTVLREPLHLVVLASAGAFPTLRFPRVVVVLEPRSQASLIETHLGQGAGAYLSIAVTEVALGPGAVLDHTRVEEEGPGGFHVGTLAVREDRDASYTSHVVTLGGRLARVDLTVLLDGPGAGCVLDGLYVASEEQHLDHHTFVDHRKPHGTSLQRYKGILDGRARGVFDGRVAVRKDAQKTNAHQENRNLILSDEALAHTKPSLNIEADDVKCSHGATVGQLEEEPLFYLRSRGIDERTARSILTYAFAREVLERIPNEALRRRLAEEALRRISSGAPNLGELG
jgi:Fe-S cluster assembly protein SufD